MRMDIVTGDSRPPAKLDDEEIRLSLDNAKALLELHPPLTLCVVLSSHISELLREIHKRPGYHFTHRDIPDFPDQDLAEAIGHADTLRSVNPRLGVQVAVGEYQLTLMTEQARRTRQAAGPAAPMTAPDSNPHDSTGSQDLGAWLRRQRQQRLWTRPQMARQLIAAARALGDALPAPDNVTHNIYRWNAASSRRTSSTASTTARPWAFPATPSAPPSPPYPRHTGEFRTGPSQ
jgi:hypothetical protein